MGSPDGKGFPDEHPQQEVALQPFYLDKYEVTEDLYARFDPESYLSPKGMSFSQPPGSPGRMPAAMPNGRGNACPPKPNGNTPPQGVMGDFSPGAMTGTHQHSTGTKTEKMMAMPVRPRFIFSLKDTLPLESPAFLEM